MTRGPDRLRRHVPDMALLAAAAATRLPLLGATQGEPDSARFVLAVWQWVRFGAHPAAGVFTYHYYPVLAPGYFALTGTLATLFRVSASRLGLFLSALSAVAALAMAPLLFRIGRCFLPSAVAWMAALLFLLSPAVWWLGIEAHPQGLALLALLLAMLLAMREQWLWATLALSTAMLLRCDVALLFPAMAVAFGLAGARPGKTWLRLGATITVAGAAFVLGRWAIVGSAAGPTAIATVERFWGHSSPLQQIMPIVTAPGLAVAGLMLLGVVCAMRTRSGLLAAAALPGLAFWLGVTGNNVRHVAALWLPLLWAGCWGIWMRWPKALVPAALACLAMGWFLIPPNSNTTLYPAANVFAAHRLLAYKVAQVTAMAGLLKITAADNASACFIGAAANPYLINALLLQPDPPRLQALNPQWQRVSWSSRSFFVASAYSDREFVAAHKTCSLVLSLEYAPPDRHVWFWGSELDTSGWMRRAEHWAHRNAMRHAADTLRIPAEQADAAPNF